MIIIPLLLVLSIHLTGAADTVYVRRIPSPIEVAIRDGTWAERFRLRQLEGTQNQTDDWNTFYLGFVDIGTPAQTFTVVLDTGSSDLWVTAINYTGINASSKKKFDPTLSSTYQPVSGTWSIQYGSGSASGFKGQDIVGFSGTGYSFNAQIFGQATQMGAQANQPIDGICGMAYPSLSAIKTPDPWYNIIKNGPAPLPEPWFTVWLDELSGAPFGQIGGAFTFGGNDTMHCSSTCTWVPLNHELWYELPIQYVGAGSYKSAAANAISDTGTSFLIGPTKDINSIGQALGGQYNGQEGLFHISCDTSTLTTTIDVNIYGKVYSISPKNYIYQDGNQCYIAMSGSNMGDPAWILGDTFIREWCNMYDMVGNRIGLCQATM